MNETSGNAEKFAQLLERMRRLPFNPAFDRFFELGLSPSHLRAMLILRSRQPLPMKDLAEALAMTPPSVTVLTRRLVLLKLVERQADAADSRRVLLSLSTTGLAMLDTMCAERVASFEQLLGGLSTAEQTQLLTLLGRAVEALEQATERPDKVQGQGLCVLTEMRAGRRLSVVSRRESHAPDDGRPTTKRDVMGRTHKPWVQGSALTHQG